MHFPLSEGTGFGWQASAKMQVFFYLLKKALKYIVYKS